MLHLPFSDLPLKKCPNRSNLAPFAKVCTSTVFLRLQDVWLGKLITIGLLVPAAKLTAARYVKDSSKVKDAFGHDRGQKSANLGRCLHWMF